MIDEVAFAWTSKVLEGVGGGGGGGGWGGGGAVNAGRWHPLVPLSVAAGEACDVVPSSW